ncbi:Cation efflux system protein CzcB [Delftia tsuruhatensis]|uniref:efflux RND transporter periplasmic adaptor subunit n=1 Tax=Delftia tsuruhatensis TaxID=180282 RepID=UPI001E7DE8E9|nr:efflux RND transporter periplasmic adaptor subunit [Delftia tsuruhatensis]CAB5706728.1 Cation efflux system protein CzcB [Delftia tsuruhatensis]CAC9675476.1 Cation efflux system protein CzcB [Delftia tsuruhatensis]
MIKTFTGLQMAARFPVASLCAAVAAACVLAGCDASKASDQAKPVAQAARAEGVVQVKPESLKMLNIAVVADPQGTQMAWAPARVAFAEDRVATVTVPVAARVQSVRAHVGDLVKAGDELAILVSPDALRVRYEVEAARSAHDVASVEVRRQQTMVDKGVGVEVDLRAAQAKLRESAQELSRAQGTAALLGQGGGDRIVLRAPRAGVVAERKAVVGASVEAGGELFLVGDPGAMNVVAEVFESDLPGIRLGSNVQVDIPQLPKPLSGKVRHLGATLDKESRRAAVIVQLDAQDPVLRSGMQARVGLQVSNEHEMLIPVTAVLIKDESRSIVFVQTGELQFEARTVSLGRPARGMVPVVSGLKPGEKIVVRGGLLLDGAASQLL